MKTTLTRLSIAGEKKHPLPDVDNYGFPSRILYDILEESGFEVTSSLDGEYLLCINHKFSHYKDFLRKGGKREKTILLRTEPKSVYPAQYKKRIEALYGLIISPGGTDKSCHTTEFVRQDYQFQNTHSGPTFSDPDLRKLLQESLTRGKFTRQNWNNRSKNIVMLASNKFSPCLDSGYSIRRRIALMNLDLDVLQIYGKYWTSSLFIRFHQFAAMYKFNLSTGFLPQFNLAQFKRIECKGVIGEASSKFELLDDSKFLLVVENSKDYITEKIFDAFVLGVIPIYIGPKIGELGIPEEAFIQIDWDLSNFSSVFASLNDLDIESYLDAIGTFISSEDFWSKWHEDSVFKDIVCRINLFINTLNGSASEEIPN